MVDNSIEQTTINARILSLVWFSQLPINEGDDIKIHGAVQNDSGIDFEGTAAFYVDDNDISDKMNSDKKFRSMDGKLSKGNKQRKLSKTRKRNQQRKSSKTRKSNKKSKRRKRS